jgi:hypothetical protein
MGKESNIGTGGKSVAASDAQEKALEAAAKSGAGFAWVREDGAICFGDECAVLKPTESGKLGLTIRPNRCGQETGRILLDYLINTAGKGVQIEIPSEVND